MTEFPERAEEISKDIIQDNATKQKDTRLAIGKAPELPASNVSKCPQQGRGL